jgi:hypothetical protein
VVRQLITGGVGPDGVDLDGGARGSVPDECGGGFEQFVDGVAEHDPATTACRESPGERSTHATATRPDVDDHRRGVRAEEVDEPVGDITSERSVKLVGSTKGGESRGPVDVVVGVRVRHATDVIAKASQAPQPDEHAVHELEVGFTVSAGAGGGVDDDHACGGEVTEQNTRDAEWHRQQGGHLGD